MYRNKLITTIALFLLLSLSFQNVISVPIRLDQFQIKATIKDIWMEDDFCKMEIIIIEVQKNLTPVPEGASAITFGIEVGKSFEITIFFYDENGPTKPQEIPGSHGYKIGDEIVGRFYEIGDEEGTQFYMHSIAKSDENFARDNSIDSKKNLNLSYTFLAIFIISLILLAIIIYIKRKGRKKEIRL